MKIELSIVLCLMGVQFFSQDIIIKKNGEEIQAKVSTVSDAKIEYKKWSNQEGPTYSINKHEVFMIKYINGNKDVFNNDPQTISPSSSSTPEENSLPNQYILRAPASNNTTLIQKYSPEIHITTKPSKKDSKWFFPVMAVGDSSLLSTEDLEVSILPIVVCNQDQTATYLLRYYLAIKNKTDQTIYIDKAHTFRIYTDGSYKTYYDVNPKTIIQGGNTGIGINLGGIANVLNIGGIMNTLANSTTVEQSGQNSVAESYSQQRILAIPPHATAHLSEYKQAHVKGKHYENISDAEFWGFCFHNQRGALKKGEYIQYTEETSPYANKYYITYSRNENFSSYSTLNFKIYTRYIIGEFWSSLLNYKKDDLIKEIQQYIPDFWKNPNIIIGECHYISKP